MVHCHRQRLTFAHPAAMLNSAPCRSPAGGVLRFSLRAGQLDVWRRDEAPKPWSPTWDYAGK
jgi:hypothetical protein